MWDKAKKTSAALVADDCQATLHERHKTFAEAGGSQVRRLDFAFKFVVVACSSCEAGGKTQKVENSPAPSTCSLRTSANGFSPTLTVGWSIAGPAGSLLSGGSREGSFQAIPNASSTELFGAMDRESCWQGSEEAEKDSKQGRAWSPELLASYMFF